MAKVGNEAKLILRLAQEKVLDKMRFVDKTNKDAESTETTLSNRGYRNGYRDGMQEYTRILNDIIYQLEG